jgi:hypothetical protein
MSISSNVAALLGSVAGLGVPEGAGFNIVKLLQSNSPEVERRDPKYVQGAKAGDFFFHGKERPIVQGEAGFVMQPVVLKRAFVEWLPGRAGFVAQHADKPIGALYDQDERGRQALRMPESGNLVEETFFLIGPVADENGKIDGEDVWALSLRSTAITVLRNKFVAPLNKLRIEVNGGRIRPPIFGTKWRVSSERTANQDGSWFTYRFDLLGKVGGPGGPTEGELQIGYDLHQTYAPSALPASSPAPLPTGAVRPQGKIVSITSGRGSLEPTAPPPSDNDNLAGARPFAPIDDDIPY